MLPQSYLWGHLAQADLTKSQLPTDAHITSLLSTITERLANHFPNSDSVYYMDMWPFSPPLMVMSLPDTASQAVQQRFLRKPSTLMDLFYPITGDSDLIFINGEQWKREARPGSPLKKSFSFWNGRNYQLAKEREVVKKRCTFKKARKLARWLDKQVMVFSPYHIHRRN